MQLIFISAALECIGWASITVVLPSLHNKLGLTSAQVSYIAAITGLTSLLSAGLQGILSDYFSKVNLLKLSSIGQGVSQLVLGLYALDILTSWPLFVAIRILAAALKMGMIVSQAFVVDHLKATDPNAADSQTTALISSLMSWSNMGFFRASHWWLHGPQSGISFRFQRVRVWCKYWRTLHGSQRRWEE